jgi:hypothetical protein
MNLCREAIKRKGITIQYLHTTKMIADGLTKALDGKDFTIFATSLLGQQAE